MFKNKYIPILFFLSFFSGTALCQEEDLLKMLDSIAPKEAQKAYATFKTTRIINGQSIERMPKQQLDFRISHRFGVINQGVYEFFGLDQSTIFLGLEYGITDWLMVGIDRTSFEKTLNGFLKFSILRQSTGAKNIPVSLSYMTSMSAIGTKWDHPERDNKFSSRLSYVHQVLIARKFNESFSFQISPTIVHRNLVATALESNDIFATGLGARFKLSRRISLNAEYFYALRPFWNIKDDPHTNSLAIGFDIETGGHVFQIFVGNSLGMIERTFITETTEQWTKGDIHIGFNISRVFSLKRDKTKKNE